MRVGLLVVRANTTDLNQLQISKDYLNVILDYAEHLAAFKMGGEEFRHTYRAAANFFAAALAYNQRLAAQSPNLLQLIRQSTQDDYTLPMKKRTFDPALEEYGQQSDQSEIMRRLQRET